MYIIVNKDGADRLKQIALTTVTLSHDMDDPQGARLHMFFCCNCGTPLGQYKGFVYSIHPGSTNVPLPWIQRCDTCKHKFGINAIV